MVYRKQPEDRQTTDRSRNATVVPIRDDGMVVPEPPDGLLPETARIWTNFWESEMSAPVKLGVDEFRLNRWVRYVDAWHRAMEVFEQEPMVEGSQGQPRVNPIWKTIVELEKEIRATELEFGLTPLARSKLGISFGQAQITAQSLNDMMRKQHDVDRDTGEVLDIEGWESASG